MAAISFLVFIASTLAIWAGLFLLKFLGRWKERNGALFIGVGVGILFASFLDLTKETAGIGTSSLRSPLDLLNLVALGTGLLAFLVFHASGREGSNPSLALLYLWAALGIGFHSAGEGMVIGYDFTTGATVLSLSQISSYLLHKAGEGLTIGLLLIQGGYRWRHAGLSGLIAGFPTLLGVFAGIAGIPASLSTLFFAVGAGATIYMVNKQAGLTGGPSYKAVLGIFLGFLYMYFSGVLHQFE